MANPELTDQENKDLKTILDKIKEIKPDKAGDWSIKNLKPELAIVSPAMSQAEAKKLQADFASKIGGEVIESKSQPGQFRVVFDKDITLQKIKEFEFVQGMASKKMMDDIEQSEPKAEQILPEIIADPIPLEIEEEPKPLTQPPEDILNIDDEEPGPQEGVDFLEINDQQKPQLEGVDYIDIKDEEPPTLVTEEFPAPSASASSSARNIINKLADYASNKINKSSQYEESRKEQLNKLDNAVKDLKNIEKDISKATNTEIIENLKRDLANVSDTIRNVRENPVYEKSETVRTKADIDLSKAEHLLSQIAKKEAKLSPKSEPKEDKRAKPVTSMLSQVQKTGFFKQFEKVEKAISQKIDTIKPKKPGS